MGLKCAGCLDSNFLLLDSFLTGLPFTLLMDGAGRAEQIIRNLKCKKPFFFPENSGSLSV